MRSLKQGITVALVLGCAITARAQDEGVKKVEQLARKARATVQAITNTKFQLMKTVDVYNSLMADDNTDRKGTYKKLQQQMAATEERRLDIAARAAEMDTEAEIVFKSWADTAAAIEDTELRKRSEERLATARHSHAQIHAVGQRATDLYGPVMQALQDQVTYLGHDLNPAAVASLAPDKAKLNRDVQELLKRIDETIGTANAAIAGLGPQ